MCSAESVIHIHITQCGHFSRQRFVIFFLALVDAAVFQQHDFAGFDVYTILNPVLHQGYWLTKHLGQAFRDWCQ